jgi:hypothetical protein
LRERERKRKRDRREKGKGEGEKVKEQNFLTTPSLALSFDGACKFFSYLMETTAEEKKNSARLD